jgi:methyl-accepting chemotaxis protein
MQFEASPELLALVGEAAFAEIDTIGAFRVRLLTATTSGIEAIFVNTPGEVTARINSEIDRLRAFYAPFIARVQAVAEEATGLIAAALRDGDMTQSQLFDTDYRLEEGSDPATYRNQAVTPLEACARALLEREIETYPNPDFCILQDRNGFNPVHNLRYSKPQRLGDVVWNLRNSRARRLFQDRVGLSASRNLRPFLVQSYARDMGGGMILIRKEFDAPIYIARRHWGTVRMAYELN